MTLYDDKIILFKNKNWPWRNVKHVISNSQTFSNSLVNAIEEGVRKIKGLNNWSTRTTSAFEKKEKKRAWFCNKFEEEKKFWLTLKKLNKSQIVIKEMSKKMHMKTKTYTMTKNIIIILLNVDMILVLRLCLRINLLLSLCSRINEIYLLKKLM